MVITYEKPRKDTLKRYQAAVRKLRSAKTPITASSIALLLGYSRNAVEMFLIRHPEYVSKWGVLHMKAANQKALRATMEGIAADLEKHGDMMTVVALARRLSMNRSVLHRHFREDPRLRKIIAPYLKKFFR